MQEPYRVPDYYPDFACKCGACRESCCSGWGISVSMEEYFRLIGVSCSAPLRRALDGAFHIAADATPERYALITPSWTGDCPLHGEDGLCALQKELGEDALPLVCRRYPRTHRRGVAVCSASCERVVEMLLGSTAPLRFVEEALSLPGGEIRVLESGDARRVCRECLLRMEDRSRPLRERLLRLMGGDARPAGESAAAAAHLSRMLNEIGSVSPSVRDIAEQVQSRYGGDGAQFGRDIAAFRRENPAWEAWFERILVNHMAYSDFPYSEEGENPNGEWRALVVTGALLEICTAAWAAGHPGRDGIVDCVASLFRAVEHTRFCRTSQVLLLREGLGDDGDLSCLLV